MTRNLDEIRYFKKWIEDIESDIFFPRLQVHPAAYPDYRTVKKKVLASLRSGDYDYAEIYKDISYMETLTNPFYTSI